MLEDNRYFLQTVLMVVGALLPIVDPLRSAPVYLQVTADVEAQSRSALARLVAIDCFLLLLALFLRTPSNTCHRSPGPFSERT